MNTAWLCREVWWRAVRCGILLLCYSTVSVMGSYGSEVRHVGRKWSGMTYVYVTGEVLLCDAIGGDVIRKEFIALSIDALLLELTANRFDIGVLRNLFSAGMPYVVPVPVPSVPYPGFGILWRMGTPTYVMPAVKYTVDDVFAGLRLKKTGRNGRFGTIALGI